MILPKVKINDIEIYYEIHGDGFPFILITGLAGDVNWWNSEDIKRYSKDFKTIIFDNRGAGRTDKPNMNYSMGLFGSDVLGLMEALNIEKTHILGSSLGGMIAQEIAINHPERVEKLILCSTHSGGSNMIKPSKEVTEMLTSSRQDLIDGIVSMCFTDNFINSHPKLISKFKSQISKTRIPPRSYILQLKSVNSFDTYSRLKQIKAPTLIIHGKKDILIPVANAEILEQEIPNARKLLLNDLAHWPFFPTNKKLMNMIIEFLME